MEKDATEKVKITAMKPHLIRNNCDIIRPRQVRRIGPTRRSVSGRVAFRGQTSISFESTLERDFLYRMEFCASVLDVIPQPVSVPFQGVNNRLYQYTPDYLVYYRLGNHNYDNYPKPVLVEVKPEKEWRANWRKWLPKWKAAWRYARQQGWVFHIIDESRIRGVALDNIRLLRRYEHMQFPSEESLMLLETVRQMGSTTVDYLLARHFMGIYRAEGISHIRHLLATRQLNWDVSCPLDELTEIWIPTYEQH